MINSLLLTISILFFSICQPNFLFSTGLPVFAIFTLFPILLLIKRISLKQSVLFGFLYGFFAFGLFAFWLLKYSIIGFFFGLFILSIRFSLLFLILKLLQSNISAFLCTFLYPIVWVIFEYLGNLGFFGINYGIIGYSFWKVPGVIQSSNIFGVWIISFLACFFSSSLYYVINYQKKRIFLLSILFILLITNYLYGLFQLSNQTSLHKEKINIALIQNNIDPWKPVFATIDTEINDLISLSEEALQQNKEIDLLVWPETAIVPRIIQTYENDKSKYHSRIMKVLSFIENSNTSVLLGNDYAEKKLNNEFLDYNAALLFTSKKNTIPPKPFVYAKKHLVPITEKLPLKNQKIRNFLESKFDLNLWEKGNKSDLLSVKGFKFSSPICFEDTFGNEIRKSIKNGGLFIVNLSNDSWAKSLVSQNQHLSMAVFRSVENKVYSVRATASGQTVIINTNGLIIDSAKPFIKDFIENSIYPKKIDYLTIYSKYGDFLPLLFIVILFFILIIELIKKKR